ncbi:mediator of RNA polymerase II transcription subunit 11-like protein [Dinothrombium tinctorium]|uniref:Mediator of RNA polymerase II transcription subunit 11 n=1 Tax=Dinothrombium tinctorium TaxID=1965070 RepID=A0A3S3RJ53_9ACAR|nr:mediator of RNA polymerase II transcription subunit 11-like protein [Dinothrombium tinctorium]RWS05812.1 mediator of RNA polymerase II transcription subunit 11-like protein [Dinothrombium tinctorium]
MKKLGDTNHTEQCFPLAKFGDVCAEIEARKRPQRRAAMSECSSRLRELDTIEKELQNALQSAGIAIQELSKDKPTIKQVEMHSNAFIKSLHTVEKEISKQIEYLTQSSTGQAHEGSCYASQKVLNMAWHRLEHARLRLNDLERCRLQYLQQTGLMNATRQQQPLPQQPPNIQQQSS